MVMTISANAIKMLVHNVHGTPRRLGSVTPGARMNGENVSALSAIAAMTHNRHTR